MIRFLYYFEYYLGKIMYKLFRESLIKNQLFFCGKNVHISQNCNIKGVENITICNDVSIGPNAILWSTRAKIIIHNKVIIGPNLSIITGDHKYNTVGKFMYDINDEEKEESLDQNVEICEDVWIGGGVTILKGVTINQGCIIGAGSVVTNSTEPYGVYAGVPAKKVKDRFNNDQIKEHKKILKI